jgi:hypothetical protein
MESGSALPWHIILFLHLTTCAIQAVVASLISAPKIELHHKAVLGRLAYEIKVRQQCMLIPKFPSILRFSFWSTASGRPQKNTFVTSTLDMVQKLVICCLIHLTFVFVVSRMLRVKRRIATETSCSFAERV